MDEFEAFLLAEIEHANAEKELTNNQLMRNLFVGQVAAYKGALYAYKQIQMRSKQDAAECYGCSVPPHKCARHSIRRIKMAEPVCFAHERDGTVDTCAACASRLVPYLRAKIRESEANGMKRAIAIAVNHDAGKVAVQMMREALAEYEHEVRDAD